MTRLCTLLPSRPASGESFTDTVIASVGVVVSIVQLYVWAAALPAPSVPVTVNVCAPSA